MTSESFVDLVKKVGEQFPPSLEYNEVDSFPAWQAAFRAAVRQLRGPLPPRVPLAVQSLDKAAGDGFVRLTLRITVSEVSSLIAYLLVPAGIRSDERRPALVVSHGHAQYGIDAVCGVRGMEDPGLAQRAYALFAVQAGYVVLAPAWWGWHGRDGHLDRVGARDRCNVIQMAASMYGFNVLDLHIQDGQAAIDVLASRPEVDPERIGCIGNSYGGRTTMWLSIFDERIRACVPSGCMNTFRERSLKLGSCAIQYLPGILRYGDVPELFSLVAPRPMQLQSGQGDALITPDDRDHIDATVRAGYRALGAEDMYEHVSHGDGHMLRWDLAAPFLDRHLQVSGER